MMLNSIRVRSPLFRDGIGLPLSSEIEEEEMLDFEPRYEDLPERDLLVVHVGVQEEVQQPYKELACCGPP